MSRPVRHPLRDALTGGDDQAPVTLTSGIVTAHSESGNPYTVTLQLPDGAEVPDLTYPAWWVPRTGDVVHALSKGAQLIILGPVAPALTRVAPHRHDAADIDGSIIPPPPPPPPTPPPPPPPPTRVTRTVQPIARGSRGPWGWLANDMRQGGPSNDAYWLYGSGVAAAKGGGTIVGGSIYIERLSSSHGVNGAANVRLGTHGFTSGQPSGGIGNVAVVGRLQRGKGRTFTLTSAMIAALNAGADGFGLLHGESSYSSADYLRATAAGASGALSLTIQT